MQHHANVSIIKKKCKRLSQYSIVETDTKVSILQYTGNHCWTCSGVMSQDAITLFIIIAMIRRCIKEALMDLIQVLHLNLWGQGTVFFCSLYWQHLHVQVTKANVDMRISIRGQGKVYCELSIYCSYLFYIVIKVLSRDQ